MADIFIDGFDKYGPAGLCYNVFVNGPPTTPYPSLPTLLTQEWTALNSAGGFARFLIVAPLSGKGQALQIDCVANTPWLSKSLTTNYSRLIGGTRFNVLLVGSGGLYIPFFDGANAQCSIVLNTAGQFEIRSGSNTGTLLGTGTGVIGSGATHYLEWDITFGAAAAFALKLDGVTILTGTGNTRAGSANNYANTYALGCWSTTTGGNTNSTIYDDHYLFDSTGTTNNAMLGTNPVVETQFAISDNQTQFTNGATILGAAYCATNATNAPGANQLFLRKFTAQTACTLNSVTMMASATSATAKCKAVVYADSGGNPGALLSSGTEFVGVTSGTLATGALVTPQALTANTAYWIGFITDTSVALNLMDTTLTGVRAANTYTSGAPSTAPAMTTGQNSWMLFGNCTGSATNWPAVSQAPSGTDVDFASSSTVNNEDLYNFSGLSQIPATVYTVCVKGCMRNTTSGVRTMNLQTKSGGVDNGGSNTGQSSGLSYQWLGSFFDTDPATAAAWAQTGLNAAVSGMKVAS